MNKVKTLALATTMLTCTSALAADLSTTISVTDDYRFRGISQSAGDPAIQGTLDLTFENGFYAGVFASNIDFDDGGKTEVDYYGGYYTDLTDDLGVDLSVAYYTYPGYDFDIDYAEFSGILFYRGFAVQLAYSDDYLNFGESATYVGVDYEYVVSEKISFLENVSIALHAGHSSGDYWDKNADDIGTYSDFSVGIAADIKGFNVKLAYLANGIDDGMEVDDGPFINEDAINITISRTFDLASF